MSESKKFAWQNPTGGVEIYDLEFDKRSIERAVERVKSFAPIPELTDLEKIDLRERLRKNIEIAKNTKGGHMEFDPYSSAAVEFLIENYDYDPRKTYNVAYNILRRHLQKKQEERHRP